jgi:hypothetical protein
VFGFTLTPKASLFFRVKLFVDVVDLSAKCLDLYRLRPQMLYRLVVLIARLPVWLVHRRAF